MKALALAAVLLAGPGRWAALVGVSDYLDRDVAKLRYPAADARLLADTLVERCGYEREKILLMTDDQKELGLRPWKENIDEKLPSWLLQARDGDTVLLFFSGHGFLDERGQMYVAPQDCRPKELALTGLKADHLRDLLAGCRATQKLLVLDCCHAGSAKGGGDAGPSGQELSAAFRKASGLISLASCRKQEKSYEWAAKGHGLFTWNLAEGLGGAADADSNGMVDSDELYKYAVDKVTTIAQRELNVRQTPVRLIGEDVVGVFALSKLSKPTTSPAPASPSPLSPTQPSTPDKDVQPVPRASTAAGPLALALSTTLDGGHGVPTWSADGKRVAALGASGNIAVWDSSGKEIAVIEPESSELGSIMVDKTIALSADGRLVMGLRRGSHDRGRIFDVGTGREIAPLAGREVVRQLVPCSDGRVLALFDRRPGGPALAFVDLASRERTALPVPAASLAGVQRLAVAADRASVAIADARGNVAVHDTASGARLFGDRAHAGPLTGLALSPDGRYLIATAAKERAGRLYDVRERRRVAPLIPDSGDETTFAFHPRGIVISMSSGGSVVEFWHLGTARRLGEFALAPVMVVNGVHYLVGMQHQLALSPDGSSLAVGFTPPNAGAGTVRLYEVSVP